MGKGLILCSFLHIPFDQRYIPQFRRDDMDPLINSLRAEYCFLVDKWC